MVCKEEVITWFQNLQAHKRIEAMYMFLNMCYPLELRFCGTCLEDLARQEYYILREKELEANNVTEVSKIRNLHDHQVRNHLIIVLSLLNSSNTICAKEIFRILSEEIKLDVLASLRIYSDSKLVEQYLLLLTLAQHHPAFNFIQQNYLAELSTSIENCAREELYPRTKYECEERYSQPIHPYVNSISEKDVRDVCNSAQSYRNLPPVHRRASDYYQNLVRITNLKVKPPHRKQSIRIRVSWSSNKPTDTFKTPKELMVFHQKLLESYPNEVKGTTNQEKFIPTFPQSVVASQLNPLNDVIITALSEYVEQLNTRLPGYILENEFVTSFFLPSNHTRTALTKSNRSADVGQGDIHSRNSRLRSLTIYNSQIGDNNSGHRPECRQKVVQSSVPRKHSENGSTCGRTSPLTSPLQSPSSSPYASPISSETNSRAGSPWNSIAGPYFERNASNSMSDAPVMDKVLVKDQIQEQWDTGRKIEEIQGLPIEELQALGILRDDGKKRKVFDMKSPPNGIINTCISKSLSSQKQSLLMQQSASNDSSPVCSEYSSPPQSPSPAEGCNQSTSLSSSNEENLDKRTVKTLPDLLKIEETDHSQNIYDLNFKRTEDDAVSLKSNLNRTTISVIPFPHSHYSSIISQLPPQNMKPAYLPIPCRTNNAPQHLSPSAVVFDNSLRLPLPSALTYLQGPPRSHAVTPDRVLSTPNIPISSVSPFPVVTSGCATLPSATCCITSHKSSTVTVVTNSAVLSNRHTQKNPSMRDTDVKPVPQPGETAYASAFILSSSAQLTPASCSCFTTNSARPSPAPSPSMSPGATPQQPAVPVSLPYLGMPYVFHHSIPFLTAQASANGFVPQPGISNPGQSFGFAALNGLATLPPELVYPAQTFALQSPSTQGNPGQVASPGSQCYGAFPQTAAVPIKLMPTTSCCNCGKLGHRVADCKEPTMDDMNKTAKFQLNYTPIPKIPDE